MPDVIVVLGLLHILSDKLLDLRMSVSHQDAHPETILSQRGNTLFKAS